MFILNHVSAYGVYTNDIMFTIIYTYEIAEGGSSRVDGAYIYTYMPV